MAEAAGKNLYDHDFYAWTQDQAARLRQFTGDNRFDAENVAEEIADLGKEALNKTASNLERCFEHLVKLAVSPATAPTGKWRGEVYRFAGHVRRYFTESMRDRIDVEQIWRDAVQAASEDMRDYGETPPAAPGDAPLTLDAILDRSFDIDDAIATVRDVIGEDGTNGNS